MGTRADFYIGTGASALWLGSIAYDGYPDGKRLAPMVGCDTEEKFREAVDKLSRKDDFTSPELGWPWPWDNSHLTDYAYSFNGERVVVSCFGGPWVTFSDASDPNFEWPDSEDFPAKADVPDMSAVQNVTLGNRSGLLILKG